MPEHLCLDRRGYVLNKDRLSEGEVNSIKKELTMTPMIPPAVQKLQGVKPIPFPIYLESPRNLYVPRFWGIGKFGLPVSESTSEGLPIDVEVRQELLPHQQTAYQKLCQQLRTVGGGVLSVYCGGGKTFMAIKSMTEVRRKTLVIVNKEFLMDQWVDSIVRFSNARVGTWQRDKADLENKDVVIAMIHSLCLKDYPQEYFDQFGYVIVDECHHLGSEMFSRCLPKISARFTLGLSATPKRRDGLSDVFYFFLGPLFHVERRIGNNRVLVKQIEVCADLPAYQVIRGQSTLNTPAMVSALADCRERNRLILEVLRAFCAQGRKTLLVSHRRESHLPALRQAIESAGLKDRHGRPITCGLYHGRTGMNKKKYLDLLETSARCDVILGTFQVASEGLDIPDLNSLVLSTPTIEVEQAVGRILRKTHRDLPPVVVDLVDMFANFPKQAQERRRFYVSEDYQLMRTRFALDGEEPAWQKLRDFLSSGHPEGEARGAREARGAQGDQAEESAETARDFGGCVL
ncbi:MAG: DEAD/DEAH box helicase [Sulfobacillus sp.]